MSEQKVQTHQRFLSRYRLMNSDAYALVFKRAKKLTADRITFLFRTNEMETARLGLAISKNAVKKSTDRNRLKRMLREGFRQHRSRMLPVDIVVVAYKGLGELSQPDLQLCLNHLWKKLYAPSR